MTPEEFNAEFDKIRKSAFRFEGLAVYDIDEEDEDLVAWQRGLAMAERSVRTSPWLARIARQTVIDGVTWCRARWVPRPLSWYLRWEIAGYVESQACGEQILLTEHHGGRDFWLFDEGTPHAWAVIQHFDDRGVLQRYERVSDEVELAALSSTAGILRASGVPLNEWLAEHADELQGAARAAG
jgi:hypothetical protein